MAKQEVTKVGAAVCRLLAAPTPRRAMLTLTHPSTVPQLIYQTWVVAMRREFGRDPHPGQAVEYVRDALRRGGESVRAGLSEALVNLALEGPTDGGDGLSRAERHLVLPLLIDLVRARFDADADLADLVRAGERRLARVRRKAGRPMRDLPALSSVGGPRTVVGQRLKAQAMYDRDRLRELPEEPSDEAITAMVEQAAAAALRRRFGGDARPEALAAFGRRVARWSPDPRLDADIAVAVVRAVLAGGAADDVPEDLALHAKARVLLQLVEDLGWYEREIDALLVAAEEAVTASGVRLRQMP